ncbi:MAG: RNA polymerase sigma factor [Bacteroidetes bacterium]|nr:RNA polymerase sigma factor [Bacteroidota bacterium]
MKEAEIIQGCQRNDSRCQQRLYELYYPLMSSIALRYSSNIDEARQGLNFAFLKVLQNIEKYNPDYALATWIRTIFVRHFIDEYRKQQRTRHWMDISSLQEYELPSDENQAVEGHMKEFLDHLLALLPLSSRTVFCMHAVDGFSYAEIAGMLEITEATCRWHVNSARKKLQELLKTHELKIHSQAL